MSRSASPRHLHLDGLRGLAALLVVIDHPLVGFDMALLTGAAGDSVNSWDIAVSGAPFFLAMSGNLSVDIFFLLSGYVLCQAFYRSDLGLLAQLVKRYVRLALPIAIACLISYALFRAGLMRNQQLADITKSSWLAGQFTQTPSLIAALREGVYQALLYGVPGGISYDSSLWTMPIEFYGSLGLILVFWLSRFAPDGDAGRRRVLLVGLPVLAVLFYSSYLGLFALGAFLSLAGGLPRLGSRIAPVVFVVGLFLGTLPASPTRWAIFEPIVRLTPPLPVFMPFGHSVASFWHAAGALLILFAADSWTPFRRFLTSPPLQFLGHVSFPLYLIHIPIFMSLVSLAALQMFGAGWSYGLTEVLSILLLVLLSLLAASGLYYVSERPAIAWAARSGRWVHALQRRLRFSRTSA